MQKDTAIGANNTDSSTASESSTLTGSSKGYNRPPEYLYAPAGTAIGGTYVPIPLEGRKLDTGKAPVWQGVFQYFAKALKAVAEVSRYGKEKYKLEYSDINWSRVDGAIERYSDAIARHTVDPFIDGPYDPESKLLHSAHRAWNALAVLEKELETFTVKENDNKT